MSNLTFTDTHNMVAFLDKPVESDGFHKIIDFLNANQIRYALTVNPTIYTSCIEQFWATVKAKTVNGERQIQALIDKKKVIIMETSIRSNLHLEDAGGTDCLPTATIFEEMARMGLVICHNTRREGKDFSGRITPLFQTMMVQPTQDEGVDSGIPVDSLQTPITSQPSSSRSQKKQSRRKQRKNIVVTQEETQQDTSVPTPSNDPPLSAKEIVDLKKRVQKLERKKKLRTTGFKRLRKVGMSRRVESSEDKESLVDDSQGRSDDAKMFNINDLHSDEVNVDMPVDEKQEQSVKEIEVNTSVEANLKLLYAATTTTTTTRPKARGVVVQEPSEFRTLQESQPLITKDKGKAIMIELEVPLKRKDQVALDEDLARNLQAQLEAEIIEEEKLARKQEEEANIALIESWDNTQAIIEVNFELAQRLQTEEQGEITIKERSRLFVELMNKRKKHFAMLRAEEKRRKPPTKAQKRNQMSTYLKNMSGYKHNQLKNKSYEEIEKMFDNEIRRVNSFIPMNSKVVKSKKGIEESSKGKEDELESNKSKKAESSEEKAKGSRKKMLGRKRAGKEKQQESSKKQRIKDDKETDEHEEDDEAELKKHLVIVKDDEIAIDAIPLATKPLVIVQYKLLKEGIMVHYQLIRADGSSKRYSSMIRMLQDIDREDLETLWKLVKTKHGDTRPEDEHERVLLGNFKVMFEPDIRSKVWRDLQGYTVTGWKLYDSCGVHFVRFGNVHIFMLVEKRYPLTPITITNMLNKKLQTDHFNEMCYQLLKLMIQKMNIKFRGGLLGLKRLQGFLEVTTAQEIPTLAAFQTDDLDPFDSDYDETPFSSAVLIAKLSSYDSEVLLDIPSHDNYLDNHVIGQNVQEMQYSEQPVFNNETNIDITSDSNMISYEQYLKETKNAVVQDTSSSAQQDAMIMSMIKEMS
ncbi:hypothetical protein Tco_0295740 [Tanacetum coccineum]